MCQANSVATWMTVIQPTSLQLTPAEENQAPAWSEVIKKRQKTRPLQQIPGFQQSQVVAEYRDQQDKKRCASS